MNSFGRLSLSLPICRMGVPLHLEVPHVPLPFPIPSPTPSTAPGIPQPRFTFSHTLGAVAHHVHRALARQDYHAQHASRAREVPQPVGLSGSDTGADGAGAGAGAPLAKHLWYVPNRGPFKAPRFRAPRKLWSCTTELVCSSVAPWLRLISSRKARLPPGAGGELEHGAPKP